MGETWRLKYNFLCMHFKPCNKTVWMLILLFFMSTYGFGQIDSSRYSFQSLMNLTYKVSQGQDSSKLDLFLPAAAKQRPVPLVIVVHGGGWAFGDKEMESIYYMRKLKEQLLQHGYAVASIGYSLVSDSVHFPTPVQDCRDAVKWLYKEASTYGLDTANYGIWGGSAGAHLAMLIAYADRDQFAGDPALMAYPSRLNYVVDNFGPTDLNALFKVDLNGFATTMFKWFVPKLHQLREKLTFAMTGVAFKDNKDEVRRINEIYSPLPYVTDKAVPTLIFHGDKDKIVAHSQSEALKKVLDGHGVWNELITVEGGDHGFNNVEKEKTDALVGQTIDFIKQQTRNSR